MEKELELYEQMCEGCRNEKHCHEECETCDSFKLKSQRVFVVSDSHFNHFNVIKYCNRPYPTLDLMNSAVIRNWNNTISKDDIVLFLGDFLFAKKKDALVTTALFAAALNGHKVIVKGNHDYKNFRYIDAGFLAEYYQELIIGNKLFCHSPYDLKEWCKKFDHVYYGHVHDKLIVDAPSNSTNVCLDANEFRPLDITNQLSEEELILIHKLINLD